MRVPRRHLLTVTSVKNRKQDLCFFFFFKVSFIPLEGGEEDLRLCRRVVGASQRLVPALQPRETWFVCSLGWVLFLLGPIWIRKTPIEWLRQKESSTKGQRSWIWMRDKPGEEWKEVQGGRPQWNNSPYNRFDILYMPEDSKHCVIIYKWLSPLSGPKKAAERLCRSLLLLRRTANRVNGIINGKWYACLIKMSLNNT